MHEAQRPAEGKKKKLTTEELIEKTAQATGQAVVSAIRRRDNMNFYRTTERLLRSYKKYCAALADIDAIDFFPQGKSRDISIAPPPGSGLVDKVDLTEAFVRGKVKAFEAMITNWHMAEIAIRAYEDRKEFLIIRMFYFNEDAYGHDRGDAPRYTWEEIAEELAATGMNYDVRTLRNWRSRLIQEMTVLLFGVDGALSIENREARRREEQSDEARI